MKALLLLMAMILIFSSAAYSQTQTIHVNAKSNCCMSLALSKESCMKKAAKIQLSPGEYEFQAIGGSVSRYPTNKAAVLRDTKPWFWLVMIYDGDTEYKIGNEVKYNSQDEALSSVVGKKLKLSVNSSKMLYFFLEDEYESKDKCSDNRGEAIFEITKVQ